MVINGGIHSNCKYAPAMKYKLLNRPQSKALKLKLKKRWMVIYLYS